MKFIRPKYLTEDWAALGLQTTQVNNEKKHNYLQGQLPFGNTFFKHA